MQNDKFKLKLATNGYIVEYPEGDIMVYNDFDSVLKEAFGFLEEELINNVRIQISLYYGPDSSE